MTANGRSGIRRRQRRRSKAERLADLMQQIGRLPRGERVRIVTKIQDMLSAARSA